MVDGHFFGCSLRVVLGVLLTASGSLAGCQPRTQAAARTAESPDGVDVVPPFAVRDDLTGLFLVWFDAQGPHTARTRSEIPEGNRQRVRVDSLVLPPSERLDPAFVYVADIRTAGADGNYPVRRVSRERFDTLVDRAAGRAEPAAPSGTANGQPAAGGEAANAQVTIFGASWCGACRSAAAYLHQRNVPFVERDIERDPSARSDMQRRAQAAGVQPSGIPVIDVRGKIMVGFDASEMDRLLRETS